jgi:hypothetical protein
MVFPYRPAGFAGGPDPIPVYGLDYSRNLKPRHAGRRKDKVTAGINPAAQATLGALWYAQGRRVELDLE